MISLSLKELKTSTLNACWKKIWPLSVEIENRIESSENEIGGILQLAKSIGADGLKIWPYRMFKMEEEIGEANLLELASEDVNQVDSEESAEHCEVNKLTLKKLRDGLSLAENFIIFFNADDGLPHFSRAEPRFFSPLVYL
ncbi:hypothetical protein QE152_g30361 [Popillia japonica]|uniref:Uncharacterized protein n=1 Tax=Popillia japonica TaxID=7064 RepID=A0AAW1JEZ5_POPJA